MIVNARSWQRPTLTGQDTIAPTVRKILEEISSTGDKAIDAYSEQFDNKKPALITLKPFEDYDLSIELKNAIKESAARIERFARLQKDSLNQTEIEDLTGVFYQQVSPIERAGCYIPGGRFPLISTALMTLIPAKVAGCKERVAVSPSSHPALLAAASLAGATAFLNIGGVQGIASLAYGYNTIEPVDIIVGPGNAFVNEAKAQLQSKVKIDGLAGPSELMALCDDQQPIEWLAYDALAQSEHDPMALSVIVSDSQYWLSELSQFLNQNEQFKTLIGNEQIVLLKANDTNEMIAVSNQFAAEHLMLCDQRINKDQLKHFGSLFIGANSAVAFGDYCSGPNHTLPTLGYAKQTGGLNVQTFLRIQTVQTISDQGVNLLAAIGMPVAEAEGLRFHYESMNIRIRN